MASTRTKWLAGGSGGIVLAAAVALGTYYEGVSTTAYVDDAGVATICRGHTQGVKKGDTATLAQCDQWLHDEMGDAYRQVLACIKTPLSLGQAVAFTDAVYNLGPRVVCGSTLQQLANAGDLDRACLQLVNATGADGKPTGWTKAAGKILPGLISRREAETIICLRGVSE